MDLNKLLAVVRSKPLQSARELCASLGISQSTLSRGIKKLSQEIVVVGGARTSSYVALQTIRGLGVELPVYSVDEYGAEQLIARVQFCLPTGFLFSSPDRGSGTAEYFPHLPYWLNDVRPTGFLGRLIPRRHPEMNLPEDVRAWSDVDCLHYWTALGSDLIGDLIIGEKAYLLHATQRQRSDFDGDDAELPVFYQQRAAQTIKLGVAGSSAGGEQPKFLAVVNGRPCLVKFSSAGISPLAKRRQDLLLCEHLALQTLASRGKQVSISRLHRCGSQVFLELQRFDRTKVGGRRGVISLATLDNEFLGDLGNWRSIAAGLLKLKLISADIYREILWRYYFGLWIANSDMHSWNLSLYARKGEIHGLAPIYDMLPMQLAPVHEELLEQEYRPIGFLPEDREIWSDSSLVAATYWEAVESEALLSEEVRRFASIAVEGCKRIF
jgi:hypothetical protein